jgi:hypothetical protein
MSVTVPTKWLKQVKLAVLCVGIAILLLIAYAFLFTREPMFVLKWFFGLQADD